jgi:hypothetical protein
MKLEITNHKMGGSAQGNLWVGCEHGGSRYHVWVNPETLTPIGVTLYKNPITPDPQKRHRTIHLDLTRGFGAKLGPIILSNVQALHKEWKVQHDAEEQEKQNKRAQEQHAELVRRAAPDLLSALRKALPLIRKHGSYELCIQTITALEKAGEKTANG